MSASVPPTAASARRQTIAFAASLVRQAGRSGAVAVFWVAAGAVLEGLGLALLVPLIGLIVSPGDALAWLPG